MNNKTKFQRKLFLLALGLFVGAAGISVHNPSFANCNSTIPDHLRLPKISSGKDYTVYQEKVENAYYNDPKLFEELFKLQVAEYNNISGSVIHFPSGPKHVYRSAMLAYSPDTIAELMQERDVKAIFHLSNKKTVDQKAWTSAEKEIFESLGGRLENYIHVLDFDYAFKTAEDVKNGQRKVAEIIFQIGNTEGNIAIHCLGGEHKTELIFEVMQKCYNKVGMDNIIERYKCHTAWSDLPNALHGYKAENVDFIRDFPCELLVN